MTEEGKARFRKRLEEADADNGPIVEIRAQPSGPLPVAAGSGPRATIVP